MKNRGARLIASLLLCLSALAAVSSPANAAQDDQSQQGEKPHKDVCSKAHGDDAAHCHAQVVTDGKSGRPQATVSYTSGYGPADLQAAYKLPALPAANSAFAWNGQTVAIVDAYDNPNVAADLVKYRKQFGLPLCATASATPTTDQLISCLFTKVNQAGLPVPLPPADIGWGQEIALDVQMVSATCPQCKILLVEANSNYYTDLGVAVDRAALMGVNAISNSYGGPEFSAEASPAYEGHFNHPGIAITVSSGDSGYGTSFPAASRYVTAVGGTSLKRAATTRGWTESAWSGAGSGCSFYITKPAWQSAVGSCSNRVIADVAAVADPNTGVAVYDSYGSTGGANWYVFGGTSVSAPIIAGVYALAGNAGGASPAINYGEYPYSHRSALFDVTSGSNGRCATNWRNAVNAPLCTAGAGWDGPTGLGTPNSKGAF